MKTTERPQETEVEAAEPLNDVSDVLNQIAPYWRTIVGVAVVGVTAFALFGFISNNRKVAEESSWASYFEAVGNSDPAALQTLAQSSSGDVVPWAQQAAAQGKLIEGLQNLYTDRDLAKANLEEAITGFTAAAARSESIDLLNQRSLWGLGQAHEGMSDLDKAKAAYQQLLDRWPESSLAKRAQERIANLNSPETQEFYKWFFAQKPAAAPAFDAGPEQPFSVPSEPDVSIPDVGTSLPISEAFGTDTQPDDVDIQSSTGLLGTDTPAEEAPIVNETTGAAVTDETPTTTDESPAVDDGAAADDGAAIDNIGDSTEITEVIESTDAETVEVIADP